MAQIDNDGKLQLENRLRGPLDHFYDKLQDVEVTLDKAYKAGDKVKVNAFNESEGNDIYQTIYKILDEIQTWPVPGSSEAQAQRITVNGKEYVEKSNA
jgi:hypothetical protein